MNQSSSSATSGPGQTTNFSVFYVILGGAALLSIVIFPITFMFALRQYRRRPLRTDNRLFGLPGLKMGGDLQQEEPKLFDIYVKPGLQVREAEFESILPMALRRDEPHACPATNDLTIPASLLRTHNPLRTQVTEAGKAEAPVPADASQTYDVAVLITMPHPALDHWNELGEYAIGTTKLVAPASPEIFIPS